MAKSMRTEKVSSHMPEDLALSILSKLALKSLKRFRCINKSCSLFFQNPHFMTVYRNHYISNDRNHSYYNDTSIFLHQELHLDCGSEVYCTLHLLSGQRFENRHKLDLPTPFHEEDPHFYILGCGHFIGILCLYLYDKIVLWNPITNESHIIPPSCIHSVPNFILNGFGYDHVRDDYKIIRQISFRKAPLWEIYSMRCNSWKELDVNMPTCPDHALPSERLYLDGICHWWSETWSDNLDDQYTDEHYLVSFDLTNNQVFKTLVPLAILTNLDANFDMNLASKHLVVLNGSVALISWYVASISSFNDETTFHISILGEFGVTESWTKLFIIGPLSYISHPIGAGMNADIFFQNNDCELVCFDISTQIIEELDIKKVTSCNIVLCKKSLLSLFEQ